MRTTSPFLPASIRLLSCVLAALLALIPWVPAVTAQQPGKPRLARVEFEGAKRLTQKQLQTTSGLEIGQPIDVAALDAAGQRLMDSGLLKKLSYRLHTVNNEAIVSFRIEESIGLRHPVTFDNFIWFSDDELANTIRHDVPSFDGTAQDAGSMTDEIVRSLQLLLNGHKIEGKVEYIASADKNGNLAGHIFFVRGIKIPVCTLHFPGAQNIAEGSLIRASKALLVESYSRQFAKEFALNNLFPLYRELGRLRTTFGPTTASAQSNENCKDGVELTVPVEEGLIYSWEAAEWAGNKVYSADELNTALQMKPGEVANGLRVDRGLEAVVKLYGRKGYMQVSIKPTAVYDDSASKVSFRMEVKEGPQFRMGNLIVKGLPDNQTNFLRGKWEMLKGDVYDAGYAADFFKNTFPDILRKIVEERQTQGKPKPEINLSEHPNGTDLTVDVTFEFTEKKEQ